MSDYWELKVRDEFAAAHALRHYEGKCERLHGHNFAVEVRVGGRELNPRTHILLDFKILKLALKRVLDELDHAALNDLEFFAAANPSSENIARHVWRRMEEELAACPDAAGVRLVCVEVSEKDSQSAVYRRLADE